MDKKYLNSRGIAYLWSKIENKSIEDIGLKYESRTTENWNMERDLLSKKDFLYIYTDYKRIGQVTLPGLKLGDGTSFLIDLPFLNTEALNDQILNHITNNEIHVSSEDRNFWNNKINLLVQSNTETLVFNRY